MDEGDLRRSLKALMWRDVGIERMEANLTGALAAVDGWEGFALRVGPKGRERLVLLNMLLVSRLLIDSALHREESRGTHYRRDFPERDDAHWRVSLIHERGRDLVREAVPEPSSADAADRGGSA